MTNEEVRQVCMQVLTELGLLETSRLTQDELLEKCKLSRGSFYKRGLNNHPKIKKFKYKGGRNYIYSIEAVKELNELIEEGVKWDESRCKEYY